MQMFRNTLVIKILIVVVAGFFLPLCKKDVPGHAITTAKRGLYIRSEPNIASQKLGLIPIGQKVKVLEMDPRVMTIASAEGQWTKIEWNTYRGWVFGGFLDYIE